VTAGSLTLTSSAGQPAGASATDGTLTLAGGYPGGTAAWPAGTLTITAQGTIDNPSTTSVTVNGSSATINVSAASWTKDIQITEGPNVLTTIATDEAGNASSKQITVSLDTQPPARPTLDSTPAFTAAPSYQLTGTKMPGTSVWINGVQVVELDDATTWSAPIALTEGDNTPVIVTKDAAGNLSTSATLNLVLDMLPPVVSGLTYLDTQGLPLQLDPRVNLPKTNFSSVTISGSVDDSLTTVSLNGLFASRSGKTFTVTISLAPGTNTLALVATSPNGYVTSQTLQVILGTIPTITGVTPADAGKVYEQSPMAFNATASDQEQDAVEYRFILDGAVLNDWSSQSSGSWTPGEVDGGVHTLESHVRDGYGGEAVQSVEVYVLRRPISPP